MKNAHIKALSPAKINLFLRVIKKREDNYHEIETLMCCIGLYDILSINFNAPEIKVASSSPEIPDNKGNIAYKAAEIFFRELKKRDHGVEIYIQKNIPWAAGLGGGSSNAGTVLLELNKHYGKPFSKDSLCAMGLEIGADIPFFIEKKPAIATGIGEKLSFCPKLDNFWILLVFPGFGVSTAKVYKNLNLTLTKNEKKLNYLCFSNLNFNIIDYLYNDLESVTLNLYPEIVEIKQALLKKRASGVLMSGSGPSVFGLFYDIDAAKEAGASISLNKRWKVYITNLLV